MQYSFFTEGGGMHCARYFEIASDTGGGDGNAFV